VATDILGASRRSQARVVADRGIRSILKRDYGRSLRKCLSKSQVAEIIAEARTSVWPDLNREAVRLVSPGEFMRHWSRLGVQFQLAKLGGQDGLELLGFYARNMGRARRPLICVNTAHHPVAVGAAFSHEMGNHLTARIFESKEDFARMLAASAYEEHLNDPAELAADCLVSLGVMPQEVARVLFGEGQRAAHKDEGKQIAGPLPASVIAHFQTRYGLHLGALPASKGQHYLAALAHYAKLRRALLLEYSL